MGKIILVSATPKEHGGLTELHGIPIFQVGIGKVSAATNLTEIILTERPDVVINFGSCGNLKNHKVGSILQVGEIINDLATMGLSENPTIRLGNNDIKCFTTDTIYDSTHERYTDTYNSSIKDCNIVDMECYSLAQVCKRLGVEFQSYKWVSDDGTPGDWEENAKIGFENFTNVLNEEYFQNYFD